MRTYVGVMLAIGVGLGPTAANAQSCEYPGVLLVVDRSVSMHTGNIDGITKWDIARDAIATMLDAHGEQAHYGLMVYPGPSGLGAAGVEGPVGACQWEGADAGCAPETPRCSTGEVVVDVGENTSDPILAALQWPATLSHSYTPTWQSLHAAGDYRRLDNPNRRDFVILLTDGWQCCGLFRNEAGNLRCTPEDRNLLVERVERLRERDITTYIIGFGDIVDIETLQRMAVSAGTARPGCDPDERALVSDAHCYYQAGDHEQLVTMLDGIGREIALELCDGLDNDCDGAVDEDFDAGDRCLIGEGICERDGLMRCNDDGQSTQCDAVPGPPAPEACDGIDNDCDGQTDEALFRPCNTACGMGEELCRDGVWVDCDAPRAQEEICDGVDNNCDGVVDEGCNLECQPGDTMPCGNDVGECSEGTRRCEPNGEWAQDCEGGVAPAAEVCNGRDDDCDGATDGMERACQSLCGAGRERCIDGSWSDCDAPAPTEEICDNEDNDCDGLTDEELIRDCHSDCGQGFETCRNGVWGDCSAHMPADAEICGNDIDDNCDGLVDNDCGCENGAVETCGSDEGVCQPGTRTCVDHEWGECESGVFPSDEICNGFDDDCDGQVDEGALCDGDQTCVCAGCVDPCTYGECGGDAPCVRGYCLEDHCPEGLMCDDGVCVPDDGTGDGNHASDASVYKDGGPGGDGLQTRDDSCSCRLDGQTQPGLPLLGALMLGLMFICTRRTGRTGRSRGPRIR